MREISKFSKITRMIYPKSCPNQTCEYWLITPNQQTLYIETNIFQQQVITDQRASNYKTASQVGTNSVNDAKLVKINRVINHVMIIVTGGFSNKSLFLLILFLFPRNSLEQSSNLNIFTKHKEQVCFPFICSFFTRCFVIILYINIL